MVFVRVQTLGRELVPVRGRELPFAELCSRLGEGPGRELANQLGWLELATIELSHDLRVLDTASGELVFASGMVPGRLYKLPTELPPVELGTIPAPGEHYPRRHRRALQRSRELQGLPPDEWTERELESIVRGVALARNTAGEWAGELVQVDERLYRAYQRAELREELRTSRGDKLTRPLKGTELVLHKKRPWPVQRAVKRDPERLPLPGHLGGELPEPPPESYDPPTGIESFGPAFERRANYLANCALDAQRGERAPTSSEPRARRVAHAEELPAAWFRTHELPATGWPGASKLAPRRVSSSFTVDANGARVRLVVELWSSTHLAFAGLPARETHKLPAERERTVTVRLVEN